jgi:basic amino acid/polyamine antiporter, APA family
MKNFLEEDTEPNSTQENNIVPSLKLLDAIMIVSGSMIGSGIFIVSADIVRQVGSAGWLILVWLITAALTMIASTSYGELSAMYPKAGGQYTYLKHAFGRFTGFLYGWTLFTVIQSGTIAAVAVAFTKFAAYFFPALELDSGTTIANLGFTKIKLAHIVSVILITLLTYINTKGVEGGKWIQRIFTISKIAAILLIVLLGFTLGFNKEVWHLNWTDAWQIKLNMFKPDTANVALGAIAIALVGSIFSADAWNSITFIAGEVKNPKRNIGLSLILGTGLVLTLYILANLMYLSVLTLPEIANAPSDRVAVAVCNKILGNTGTKFMAVLIMISTFGCINGMILTGARVYYTMAKDKLFFKPMAQLNKNNVPEKALWAQCVWTSLLCLSGKYGSLLDYVVMAVMLFYILTLVAIFKLRITHPNIARPYKALGYPWLPILYIITALVFCILLLIYKPDYTVPGLIIVACGIPVYFIANKALQ